MLLRRLFVLRLFVCLGYPILGSHCMEHASILPLPLALPRKAYLEIRDVSWMCDMWLNSKQAGSTKFVLAAIVLFSLSIPCRVIVRHLPHSSSRNPSLCANRPSAVFLRPGAPDRLCRACDAVAHFLLRSERQRSDTAPYRSGSVGSILARSSDHMRRPLIQPFLSFHRPMQNTARCAILHSCRQAPASPGPNAAFVRSLRSFAGMYKLPLKSAMLHDR